MPKDVALRSTRSRSLTSAAGFLLALCSFGWGSAYGASPDRCDANPDCSRLAEQAAQLAAATQYEQALVLYQQAYERSAEPRLLINIGRSNYRLGRVRLALDAFLKMRAELPDGEPDLMERLQAFTADAQQAFDADARELAPPTGWDAPPASSPVRSPASATTDRCLTDAVCQQISDQAAQLAAQTSYDRSLVLYERAFARSQEPRLLLNIGRCYYRLGRVRKALSSYRALHLAIPVLEPDLQKRFDLFVAEANTSVTRDQQAAYSGVEPAPLGAPASSGESIWSRPVLGGRPLWRVAVGGGAAGLGVLFIALGAGALSAHGGCVTASTSMPGSCAVMTRSDGQRSTLLLDGVTPGVPLLVLGGALAIGGAVLIALPGRNRTTAGLRLQPSNMTLLAR